jgi:DnaJ domain
MREPPDLMTRAYATLGLQPGCSPREAARQYKRLAKRWHPDQYGNDPQGQAEAAQRMREINRAFALVSGATRGAEVVSDRPPRGTSGDPVPEHRTRFVGQRLNEADLIAQPGPHPKSTINSAAGALLVSAAAVHWIYTAWFKNR